MAKIAHKIANRPQAYRINFTYKIMSQHIKDFQIEQASPLPSPCINVCRMDNEKVYCTGCWRTIPEIVAWSRADEDYKRGVWQEIKLRVAQAGQ